MSNQFGNFVIGDTATANSLPILKGSIGPDAVDVRSLLDKQGLLTYDPGFRSTASCQSAITYIDGDKGTLLYRGYPIEQLAEHCSFDEVAHLLMHGELPSAEELAGFRKDIRDHNLLHDQVLSFYRGFRRDAHPMAVMVGVVGALSAFYQDAQDYSKDADQQKAAIRLVAKMPAIAAASFTYSIGRPIRHPDNSFDYSSNFLQMMFGKPSEPYIVDPVLTRAIELILILHADHEQNASTSTVRMAASSGANPFACLSAGIATLWGPAHGGANEAVLTMLEEIGSPENIPNIIKRAKDKNDPFRLMGFGHRVYKNYDPRAAIIRDITRKTLAHLGMENSPLMATALELERIALSDEYFINKKLYPNVDFYSGILLRAMGFPSRMFTAVFAVARTVGWVSHWLELKQEGHGIDRPRQLYTGPAQRQFERK
ncbi:MAG: citrate (Si)-synthase [Zetaproteobacteria bacterium CG06_land_8_20_14_3_00_59_53]|nr:MAG: citrate (Si)-synthase [Zetaproteobacteria bacterium CG2_30_59_37]PIO88849.1 MAG: citrate (Si)-synthase [Zetaproteobacteria bacterium CG23_combo_of_CG06-09_8_20_14_all_59_86]PIQ65153.1 MAG: citrate (Si)-synthase [Zetaproteobacteria bacterium CG11_big_fil_rev_8_21_14_0_20_59_439]PIU70732.1 MAG: citrate (Si)-synthase [Zetaproteobacteria bacterium CG06_land_8_20_14_3_00_59_53]PIU96402.1 MAG: citrate (Si)-synthase [Zetaproteobacteria bacterium CG03_land_8_20_14_0_80_59_51]PIY45275.1 MAG: ci